MALRQNEQILTFLDFRLKDCVHGMLSPEADCPWGDCWQGKLCLGRIILGQIVLGHTYCLRAGCLGAPGPLQQLVRLDWLLRPNYVRIIRYGSLSNK